MENKETEYKKLMDIIGSYMSSENIDLINNYYNYALKIYDGMTRMTGEEYICHSIRVAKILADLHMDTLTIGCALIHEAITLELATPEEIDNKFGVDTLTILTSLSKLSHLKRTFTKNNNDADKYRRIVVGLSENPISLFIKLADRLDNLRTMYPHSTDHIKEVVMETEKVYIPIAHRLGIKSMKSELEDLCLQYSNTELYNEVLEKINASRSELETSLYKMRDEIISLLNEHEIKYEITYRVKSVRGIANKLLLGKKWEEIYDLLGLRILLDKTEDCYLVVGLIHSKFRPIPKRFKDFIANPKNKLVIDAYAAGIVKEIYRMKLSGMSQTAIANVLNKQGVLSPMEYKHSLGIRIQDNFKTHEQAEWSAMSVKRILENEVYTGTLVQGKRTTPNHKVKKLMKKPETDWVRIEKNHEAIVSEREFALVQRLLGIDTRTSPNEEKVYPLSGLVVCGDCGAMMIKRDVPAGGKVYAYYICSRHAATKACAAHRIPMGKLEETVLELVKIHIENILDMKKIMDFIHEVPFQELDIKELEIRKEAKEKEAVRCRELRDYLYEDFREGIISKEDYKELHDGYTEKRKKAEEAVRSIDQQISEVLESKSDKYHWLDYFAEHQNIQELTRTVAVELIDQILVYDKKHIEVRFNFDDCYQSLLRQIQSVGCDVSTGMDGRIEIQKREVV